MSSQQKRPHEAEKPDKPNKKQNKGSVTSDPESSSAVEEELPSQDRDQCLPPVPCRWLETCEVYTSHGSSPSDPSNRLDRLEWGQDRLRAELEALHPIVESVTSELHARVQALEMEAKSPSKEAILVEENEQLRRNIAILEHSLTNQAKTLRTVQQSNTQLYNQLVQANVKTSSLQGDRVELLQPWFQTEQSPAETGTSIHPQFLRLIPAS
ncbi:uncharacterized protein B0J16DRAFT_402532 [Fusarium flagelliforme]|uniref:uncharacterized protein n=1 Tax=Fusarium flagelliforme TaxID=2675880 RepID=UPI001E8E75AF|nr:uncharacterized protein B0J16DRAFT_402532 [Fusarium flagelliforme]KAH7179142.1 hypothetical protein B0J16DRAFT_402532 [Fusarium flagelliforme]